MKQQQPSLFDDAPEPAKRTESYQDARTAPEYPATPAPTGQPYEPDADARSYASLEQYLAGRW